MVAKVGHSLIQNISGNLKRFPARFISTHLTGRVNYSFSVGVITLHVSVCKSHLATVNEWSKPRPDQ